MELSPDENHLYQNKDVIKQTKMTIKVQWIAVLIGLTLAKSVIRWFFWRTKFEIFIKISIDWNFWLNFPLRNTPACQWHCLDKDGGIFWQNKNILIVFDLLAK
jgi:hypothetical protein